MSVWCHEYRNKGDRMEEEEEEFSLDRGPWRSFSSCAGLRCYCSSSPLLLHLFWMEGEGRVDTEIWTWGEEVQTIEVKYRIVCWFHFNDLHVGNRMSLGTSLHSIAGRRKLSAKYRLRRRIAKPPLVWFISGSCKMSTNKSFDRFTNRFLGFLFESQSSSTACATNLHHVFQIHTRYELWDPHTFPYGIISLSLYQPPSLEEDLLSGEYPIHSSNIYQTYLTTLNSFNHHNHWLLGMDMEWVHWEEGHTINNNFVRGQNCGEWKHIHSGFYYQMGLCS